MSASGEQAEQWWQEPFRVVQTNIREVDAAMDVAAVGQDILDFGANAWLLNTAGIVSFYPSALDYQYPTPYLQERASGDLISARSASTSYVPSRSDVAVMPDGRFISVSVPFSRTPITYVLPPTATSAQ